MLLSISIAVFTGIGYHTISRETFSRKAPVPIALSDEDRDWIKANPVITVGIDLDFAPIEDMDKNGNYIGVTADFLSLVTARTGLTFKFDHKHSWAQNLERIKQGKVHMLGAAVASDQRRQFMNFTQPYAWLSGVIIVPKSVNEPMSLEKLEGMTVTVVHDYIWKDYLEANHPSLLINPAQDIGAALKKVSFGMADAMVGYMATASHHIERLGISNLKISGETVSVLDISFGVNKTAPQLLRILNQVLAHTTESQKKEILRKWISLEFSRAHYLKWIVNRMLLPGVLAAIFGIIAVIVWNRSLQRQVIHRTEKLNRELVQRTQMEQALRESEEKYKSIFRNIQDVYYEILPRGRLIEISPSVQKVFGYARESLINRSMSVMFDNPKEFRHMLDTAEREKRLDDYGTVLLCPDDSRLNCSINAVIIRDKSGTPVKIVGSIHNITERVKAQKALSAAYKELEQRVRERTAELRNTNKKLNKAKEEADAATRAKSNFLANMSHEIRTPLSGVISASELVMHEDPPQKIARYINIIRSSGQALLGVIDDILDFSKIEAGKLEMEIHPFRLDQLLTRTTNLFKQKIKDKNIAFQLEVQANTSSHFNGDSFRIQQILINLMNNAVKFTDNGGKITLRVSGHTCIHKSDRVFMEFEVKDSGIGISKEHQDLLFTPFSQIDASTTRKYGGSGLGLSICGQLVEMMEGTITVESVPKQGSSFQFTIPLEQLSEPESKMDTRGRERLLSSSTYKKHLKGKSILVAEDTPTNQEIIQAVLDLVGITPVIVNTGQKAVDAVKSHTFDAVLMDLQMPEMDGFEATRAIRKIKSNIKLPIIAMTAHTLKEDEGKCIAAGMNAYISKPINQEKLFDTLIRLIQENGSQFENKNNTKFDSQNPKTKNKLKLVHNHQSPALPEHLPGIEIQRAVQALGIEDAVFKGILKTFSRNYEMLISQLKSAWQNGNRAKVITLAHSLKGSAAGIGAFELNSHAGNLETLCRTASQLPSIDKAGLGDLENSLGIVLTSIQTLVHGDVYDSDCVRSTGIHPDTDINRARQVLYRLEKALEYPEVTELETLGSELADVCFHPKTSEIIAQMAAYDHEPARKGVVQLLSILQNMGDQR